MIPYLLLAIIWWSTTTANKEQDESQDLLTRRAIAAQKFENARQDYEQAVDARRVCLTTAKTRTNSRETFFAIIDYATVDNPEANADLHALIDANQPALTVEDCNLSNPEPVRPIPEPILQD